MKVCRNNRKIGGNCVQHGGGGRCQISGCNTHSQGGYCVRHGGIRCKIEGCEKHTQCGGKCRKHYNDDKEDEDVSDDFSCDQLAAQSLLNMHRADKILKTE